MVAAIVVEDTRIDQQCGQYAIIRHLMHNVSTLRFLVKAFYFMLTCCMSFMTGHAVGWFDESFVILLPNLPIHSPNLSTLCCLYCLCYM